MSDTMLRAGEYTLPVMERTLVMGILNVTPDSFSDGGKFHAIDKAMDRSLQLVEDGADIIDVGGESTRPGATPVSLEEELERVVPVIEALASRVDVPVSIDTYKAEVARQAIHAGAHIINDVWGAKADDQMAPVAAELGVPIILMHNRPRTEYDSFVDDVVRDLEASIGLAMDAGVKRERIILDPGVGFAKTIEHNISIMQHMDRIVELGFPVLLGTSRKSMIGKIVDVPVEERVEGTVATVCHGVMKGCHIVRVHDVQATKRAVTMMDVLCGKRKWESNG